MEVKTVIEKRRAYRSLEHYEITEELIKDLASSAQLAPSCFNNQPTRFIFAYEKKVLEKIFEALSPGNKWAEKSSLIIIVFSKKELDCQLKGREYYLFDAGLSTAFIILRATELGLVAHPIAGYNENKIKATMEIPQDMTIITLVNIGKRSTSINYLLNEKQIELEKNRPSRLPLEKFIYINKFGQYF